jgi:transcriptional regulator with XRE-family HTH domain
MNVGEKIQQLRRAGGLSQEQLAEMVGVSRQAISKWETGQSSPEIEKILAISKVFSISTDELLGNDNAGGAETATPQLQEAVTKNTKKRQFTIGWITAVAGLVLLIMDYLSLRIIQFTAMRLDIVTGIGFYEDPMEYAHTAPMPTIFAITAAIIILGIGLAASSFVTSRVFKKRFSLSKKPIYACEKTGFFAFIRLNMGIINGYSGSPHVRFASFFRFIAAYLSLTQFVARIRPRCCV